MTSSINAILFKKLLQGTMEDLEDVMMVFAPNLYLAKYLEQTGQTNIAEYEPALANIRTCKQLFKHNQHESTYNFV